MKKTKLILSGLLVLSLLGYCLASYYLLHQMVYGRRVPLELKTPDTKKCHYETVHFTPRGEDFLLEGWFLRPKNQEASEQKTLLFVHGIGANRISNPHTMQIAYDFINEGYQVLLFDLRTQGNSEGPHASASYYEKFDVLGAFDFLLKEKKIPKEKIGLLGFSMGGATALLAASIEPAIRALAIDSPFSDARELIAQETARATGISEGLAQSFVPLVRFFAKTLYKVELDEMVPKEAVKKIQFPIFLVHGDSDAILHHRHSEAIHLNAHKGSQLFITAGGEHTSSYELGEELYITRLLDYYKRRRKEG